MHVHVRRRSLCCCPPVCRLSLICLSVCNARAPYSQAVEIFGNFSMLFGTLAIP